MLDRETWYKVSNDTHYHRCTRCMRQVFGVYVNDHSAGMSFIIANGGWSEAYRPYPHAHDCPNRGQF